jgi:Fe2+ or Zn2+ uptake regulation protein
MIRRTRNTQQRQAVLRAVAALNGCHPTAADVFEALRPQHPRMSLATVYRSLNALVAQGQLAEIRVENVTRYDAGETPHHHIVCRGCGSVVDVCTDVLPAAALRHLEECSGFRVEWNPVQFFGLCPRCTVGVRLPMLPEGFDKEQATR